MAGFFGLFNYSKPGKGVRKDEPERSRFVQFWILVQRKFWKLIQLNLLYVLFCIPIVTIGPATAAMTYVLRLYANEQPVFMFSDFWDAFKANWKQSFVYSIICAVLTVILTFSISFYYTNAPAKPWMYILLGLCLMVGLVAVMAGFYINLMIVTLELKLKDIIKNGILLSVLGLKTNAITLLVLIAWGVLFFLFPEIVLLIMLVLGFAFFNFVIVFNSYKVVKKYAIDPFVEKKKQEDEELKLLSGEPLEDEVREGNVFTDVVHDPNEMTK